MNNESVESTAVQIPAKKERVKRIRTEEQVAADKERMAKLRAMRGKAKVPEVVPPI